MVARGWGYRLDIDKPVFQGNPQQATIKALLTSTKPPSPLRILENLESRTTEGDSGEQSQL